MYARCRCKGLRKDSWERGRERERERERESWGRRERRGGRWMELIGYWMDIDMMNVEWMCVWVYRSKERLHRESERQKEVWEPGKLGCREKKNIELLIETRMSFFYNPRNFLYWWSEIQQNYDLQVQGKKKKIMRRQVTSLYAHITFKGNQVNTNTQTDIALKHERQKSIVPYFVLNIYLHQIVGSKI